MQGAVQVPPGILSSVITRQLYKTKKDDKPFVQTIYRPFGALEGTRIPGPLIKSQMLYRLSYERI